MANRPLFQIKICGITRARDAVAAVQAGADAIGLNFFEGSSRFLTLAQALSIVEALRFGCLEKGLTMPMIVGVFVNENVDNILQRSLACGLQAVQLHGDEDPSVIAKLRSSLAWSNREANGPKLIRAVRLTGLESEGRIDHSPDRQAWIAELNTWKSAGVDGFLLDSATAGVFGGSGKPLNWETLRCFEFDLPWTLAGGLTPENVRQAIATTGARSVDVASGVEMAPGIKAEPLMLRFVQSTGWRG